MPIFIILALALALTTVFFALQNTTQVVVNVFGWELQDTLALILLVTLAIGVVVGVLVATPAVLRRSFKISSQNKRIEELDYQLEAKQKTIVAEQQATEAVRTQYQQLLAALSQLEPTTGLLQGDAVDAVLRYMLQAGNSGQSKQLNEISSLCLYLLEANSPDGQSEAAPMDRGMEQRWQRAIAQRLQKVTVDSHWLHHDGHGRFACIAPGLSSKAASEYGDAIRTAFAEEPLRLDDQTSLPTTVSMGGAIAQTDQVSSASIIIHDAEAALDQAKRRGRNRFRLVEVSG